MYKHRPLGIFPVPAQVGHFLPEWKSNTLGSLRSRDPFCTCKYPEPRELDAEEDEDRSSIFVGTTVSLSEVVMPAHSRAQFV